MNAGDPPFPSGIPFGAPRLPPPGVPALVAVACESGREQARLALRERASQILASWTGQEPRAIQFEETASGPRWGCAGRFSGLAFSFSYAGSLGWIALARGGSVGVDAALVEPFPERDAVAELYLGAEAARRIAISTDPARAFARAWTSYEAGLKWARKPMQEGAPTGFAREPLLHRFEFGRYCVCVATDRAA